ncbi:neuropeptide SIFamide-like [Hyposmocoma kahamanoa]|uniref:neuropeptide SIFamide-like n=1 Tax=Hyposmocoma kahamanoa TaxID=1477025 RepID=UPI000E6D6ECA|nr:neuropeptide SIFamide-like [Hyposmocoma kahamanoa]
MRAIILFCISIAVICLIKNTEASFKKTPFNGSIFGKRGIVDYDSTSRALSAVCEIATETCQAWYQTLENK